MAQYDGAGNTPATSTVGRISKPPRAESGAGSAPVGRPATPLWTVLLRPRTTEENNQRNVLIDSIGVGVTAGVGTFLSVLLVRLGASPLLIGLLTAMPALTGMILAMPIGEFLARRPRIVPWFATSRLFVLSSYVMTGLVPFVIHTHQPEAIIAVWALATVPQTIVAVAFTVVMGAVAGPQGRFTLMSRRWSILGLTNTVTVLLVGQLLNLFDFPLNYQVVFIGSAVGALISFAFSSSIRLPTVQAPPVQHSFLQTLRHHGATLRSNKRFVNFTIAQFVFRIGLAMAAPLFPLYWVRVVHASDASISFINSTQTAATMIAYYVWARLSQRRGERLVLLATTFGISFYPLLTALSQRWEILVGWAAMAGFFAAGVDLVFFDIVLSTCPADQQPAYVGMYQTTVYIATFAAPMIGTVLADAAGLQPAMFLGTAFRLAGFLLLAALGVSKLEPKSVPIDRS